MGLDEQRSRRPVLDFHQQRHQALAVELQPRGLRDVAKVQQGRQDVDVCRQVADVEAALKPGRPADEAGHAMSPVVGRALSPPHLDVEPTARSAVVSHVDEDRVAG